MTGIGIGLGTILGLSNGIIILMIIGVGILYYNCKEKPFKMR